MGRLPYDVFAANMDKKIVGARLLHKAKGREREYLRVLIGQADGVLATDDGYADNLSMYARRAKTIG